MAMEMFDIGGFINSSKRIFTVSKKPDWREYQTMAKITGLGIILIAIIGFVILFFFRFFKLGL
ncbi:MAG: protein translocase SEC61 complex subunit gamma [Candidatus Diapherotrites archaeon]|nr:protein translocase SEC61 complex subunit gamma [Candidatus Micrarchaeota archaeon]MBU1939424.1 protein translocase SEC61 complex subunit gamma [Candidatus Micrarchaeota archaeon]